MLQQTTVATVLDHYRGFLDHFPTVQSLAAASEDEVLALWAGLGYYSRARNLLRTARRVAADYAGKFPSDPGELRSLPGIGRYTAGAVASVAFGKRAAILDGNIRRVFSRLLAFEDRWDSNSTERLWTTLDRLVDSLPQSTSIGDFNQSLMELGALVCTPRSPRCQTCPLVLQCGAYGAGLQEKIPKPAARPTVSNHHLVVALVADGRTFLMSRHESGLLPKSLWSFPDVAGKPDENLGARFADRHGIDLEFRGVIGRVRHQITNRRLHVHVVAAALKNTAPETFRWIDAGDRSFARSSYVAKVLALWETSRKDPKHPNDLKDSTE